MASPSLVSHDPLVGEHLCLGGPIRQQFEFLGRARLELAAVLCYGRVDGAPEQYTPSWTWGSTLSTKVHPDAGQRFEMLSDMSFQHRLHRMRAFARVRGHLRGDARPPAEPGIPFLRRQAKDQINRSYPVDQAGSVACARRASESVALIEPSG